MRKAEKTGPEALAALYTNISATQPVDGKGRYLHWEDFRFKPTEGELSAAERWTLMRCAREARRIDTAFTDKNGARFFFVKTDFIERALHEIDSQTRGVMRSDGPVLNETEAESFLVTSLLEEPFSSSVLEGAVATRDQAKKIIYENRAPKSQGEQMILNNYHAIKFIKERWEEALTPSIICEVQRLVTKDTLENPAKAGVFRNERDRIVVEDEPSQEVLHAPPAARELERRVDLLCRFANEKGDKGPFIHPIIRAVILHFMLAYDHPFVDGNGRTARALFYWSVLKNDYWLLEYISISSQIKEAPIQYGKAFLETETDEGDLTYFIENQIDMIQKAITALDAFIARKRLQIAALEQALSDRRLASALNHRQLALLNSAVRAPGRTITISQHEKTTGVSYLTARSDLERLVKEGFFSKRKRGTTSIYAPVKNLAARLAAEAS